MKGHTLKKAVVPGYWSAQTAALVDRTGRLGVAPLAYNPAKDLAGEPIVSGLPKPYSEE